MQKKIDELSEKTGIPRYKLIARVLKKAKKSKLRMILDFIKGIF